MSIKTDVRTISLKALELQVESYERQYGMPSSEMARAFAGGHETADLRRWSRLYRTLQAARSAVR